MAKEVFNRCIPVIHKHEGGWVNDPDDPGMETNMGITKLFYPNLDITNLTKEKADEIYYNDYWLANKLDQIQDDLVALNIFDHCVNTRSKSREFEKCIKLVQVIVGAEIDGVIGNQTISKVNNYSGMFVTEFRIARKVYYLDRVFSNPKLEKYLGGWLRRVDSTHF